MRCAPVARRAFPCSSRWANRLSTWKYRAAGVTVDLDGLPLGVDGNRLPIHGLLFGWPGWTVEQLGMRADTARLRASTVVDALVGWREDRLHVLLVCRRFLRIVGIAAHHEGTDGTSTMYFASNLLARVRRVLGIARDILIPDG